MSAARPTAGSLGPRRLLSTVTPAAGAVVPVASAPLRPSTAKAPPSRQISQTSSSFCPSASAFSAPPAPSCPRHPLVPLLLPLPPRRHQFHSSALLSARLGRKKYKNVSAVEMGLVSGDMPAVDELAAANFPEYTDEDKDVLGLEYSPAQMAAIEAGEAAVNPGDMHRGRLRMDPYAPNYIDDFSRTRPSIDKRPRNPTPPDPNAWWMDEVEMHDDLAEWADRLRTGGPTGRLRRLDDFVPPEFRGVAWSDAMRRQAEASYREYMLQTAARVADVERRLRAGEIDDAQAREELDSEPSDGDVLEYLLDRSAWTDGDRRVQSSLAPALPHKVPGVAGLYKAAIDPADEGLDDVGDWQDLKRRTGMSVKQILAIDFKNMLSRWVTNQTRLGKIQSMSVLSIAGNQDGWLGLGMAKSVEAQVAMLKSRMLAIRNMRPVRRYEQRTIFGNLEKKVSATVVRLYHRPPGFGLRASHRIFEICRMAGIKDISARIPRSRNPMNTIKACVAALYDQPDPEEIARGRGKKLVDARKVYYGGAVY